MVTTNDKEHRGEMFYIDPKTGKPADALIHEPILAGISKEGEARLRRRTKDFIGSELGLSPAQLDQLFGND